MALEARLGQLNVLEVCLLAFAIEKEAPNCERACTSEAVGGIGDRTGLKPKAHDDAAEHYEPTRACAVRVWERS